MGKYSKKKEKKKPSKLSKLALAVFTAGSVSVSAYLLSPTIKTRQEPISIENFVDDIPRLVGIFEELPKQKKETILSQLETYALSELSISETIENAKLQSNIPEILDPDIPSNAFTYNNRDNVIHKSAQSLPQQYKKYLKGEPIMQGMLHERLHAIQDKHSKWDRFETFIDEFIPISDEPVLDIEISAEKTKEFAINFLGWTSGSKERSITAANQEIVKMWNAYDSTTPQRITIREVQAYLSTQPFNSIELLRNHISSKEQYQNLSSVVLSPNFDEIFNSIIQLNAILGPVQAAKFVGQHGSTIDEYISAVEQKASDLGPVDFYQKGMERQNKFLLGIQKLEIYAGTLVDPNYKPLLASKSEVYPN